MTPEEQRARETVPCSGPVICDPPGCCRTHDAITSAIREAVEAEREAAAQKCDRLVAAWNRGGDKMKAAGAYQAAIEIRRARQQGEG